MTDPMPSRVGALVPAHVALLTGALLAALGGDAAAECGPRALDAPGAALYHTACAACHGSTGRGAPASLVGFPDPLPDFTDCTFASREPDGDWVGVAAEGGPSRGFSEMMPAFGGVLSAEELGEVVAYIRGFCTDGDWPRGELNLPRPLVTEKAFPEDEAVMTTRIDSEGSGQVGHFLTYERRFGPRNQWEVVVPFGWLGVPDPSDSERRDSWSSALGDLRLSLKRAVHHDRDSIVSVAGEVLLPTGDEDRGFGSGTTVFEPYLAWGQILPASFFLQSQLGLELTIAHAEGRQGEVFAHLPVGRKGGDRDRLAADGVSCAVCHQITEEGLGEHESFNAGFTIDETTPAGERRAFGPYEVDAGRQTLMRSAARFVPTRSTHIQRSELCATCHTLFTHTLDESGQAVGELPEQVPYLEWLHSDYREQKSCQDCHMLEVEGTMPVASVVGLPRENVSRHVFLGGNFLMPLILGSHASELGVSALPQELETASRRTRQNLQATSARLAVEDVTVEGETLTAEIAVTNLAGHKLPTAYPSRRAWLHVVVRDAAGDVVFETGRLEDDGSIAGNDNDTDPARFEPHCDVIRRADQVQIYEPILADAAGEVTTVLLSALSYAKDNRLLPAGFDKRSAEAAVAVRGRALTDDDFAAGGDRVRYVVDVGAARGPFEIEATLWYQPISYRWAHNVNDRPSPEGARFVGYYQALSDISATVLARSRHTVAAPPAADPRR